MQKDPAEVKPLSRSEKTPSRQRTKPQKPNAIERATSRTPPQKQQAVLDRRTKRKRHLSRQSCASIPSRNRCAFEVTPPGKARQRRRATSKPAQLHLHSNAPLKPDSKRSSTTRCDKDRRFTCAPKPNTAANGKTPTQSNPAATHSKEQQRIHRAWTVVDSLKAAETAARKPSIG